MLETAEGGLTSTEMGFVQCPWQTPALWNLSWWMGLSDGSTMGTDDETVTNGFPPGWTQLLFAICTVCLLETYFATWTLSSCKKKKNQPQSPAWQRQLPEQETTGLKAVKGTTAASEGVVDLKEWPSEEGDGFSLYTCIYQVSRASEISLDSSVLK